MISIVTSTVIPKAYSYFSVEERYLQTIKTLKVLIAKGFNEIYLLDNSIVNLDTYRILKDTSNKVKIFQNLQYCFENKGLNEALLILNILSKIPDNETIFKISGRYYPTDQFDAEDLSNKLGNKDIVGVCSNLHQ